MKYQYELYQLDKSGKDYLFMGLDKMLEKHGYVPNRNEYNLVYHGKVEDKYSGHFPIPILHRLFDYFNAEIPDDFVGWAMSPSDVIKLTDENGREEIWFVDSVGFKQLDPEKW